MYKSIVFGCTFILIYCIATSSAAIETFTLKVNGTDIQYKFFDEWTTWQRARERCAGADAQLLEPESHAEAEELGKKLVILGRPSQVIWTGITDRNRNGAYRNLDGQLLRALPLGWAWGEPRSDLTKGCVQLYLSALYMQNCDTNSLYVCKVLNNTSRTTEQKAVVGRPLTNYPMTCNKTFTLQINSENVQYVFHYKYATWHQARDRCAGAGARLLAPEDEGEAGAVRGEVDQVYGYSIWTSINDLDKAGDYRTLDGRHESAVYSQWRGGRPLSWDGALRCAVLGSDSTLHLALCDSIFPYVCKFSAARERINPAPVAPIPYTM